MELDPVKTVPCKECGVKVKVNARYPITEVDCREWYCPRMKNNENFSSLLSMDRGPTAPR